MADQKSSKIGGMEKQKRTWKNPPQKTSGKDGENPQKMMTKVQ